MGVGLRGNNLAACDATQSVGQKEAQHDREAQHETAHSALCVAAAWPHLVVHTNTVHQWGPLPLALPFRGLDRSRKGNGRRLQRPQAVLAVLNSRSITPAPQPARPLAQAPRRRAPGPACPSAPSCAACGAPTRPASPWSAWAGPSRPARRPGCWCASRQSPLPSSWAAGPSSACGYPATSPRMAAWLPAQLPSSWQLQVSGRLLCLVHGR